MDAISIILCLEDAISDEEVKLAEQNIVVQIQQIANLVSANILNQADIPLLFIRVRQPSQMKKIVTELGSAVHCLCGFVFPKFTPINGKTYIDQLAYINELYSLSLYGMPILESPEIMYKETRAESLLQIKDLLDSYHDYILNVRIGATDFQVYLVFGAINTHLSIILLLSVIVFQTLLTFSQGQQMNILFQDVYGNIFLMIMKKGLFKRYHLTMQMA